MAMTMQSPEDLGAQYAAVLGELSDRGASGEPAGYFGGVADALSWVLGRGEVAPITMAPIAWPTPPEVMAEHRAAEDVLYRRREDSRSREWVGGVEHGLLWAGGGTPKSPVAGPTKLRIAPVIRDEIAQLRELLVDGHFDEIDQANIAGALGVLEWVAGDIITAPLSGRVADQAPGVEAVEAEATFVDDLRQGDGPVSDDGSLPEVSWAFTSGVCQALRWVTCRSEDSAL